MINSNDREIELAKIQDMIDNYLESSSDASVGELRDGYHSFNELYDHRCVLTALAFNILPYSWKSLHHEDGSMFDGMFIVGTVLPSGMITYHYDIEYWDLFKITVLDHAPTFDGHTPNDVVNRIKDFVKVSNGIRVNTNSMISMTNIYNKEIIPLIKKP